MRSGEIVELLLPAAIKCDALMVNAPKFVGIKLAPVGSVERVPPDGWVNQGFSFEPRYISFRGSDLNSRAGFKEGRLLEPLMKTWAQSRGWEVRSGYSWAEGQVYINYRYLLYKGVQRYLAGEGSYKKVEDVQFVESSVMPVRSSDLGPVMRREARESVHVPVKELIKLADDTFPVRSEGWLRVFSGVSLTWSGGSKYSYVREGNLDAAYARKMAGKVADIFEAPCAVLGADAWSLYLDVAAGSSFVEAVDAVAGALSI